MARHNATVTYVEPNYSFSGLTAAAGDGREYDRAPDLEDYCMVMNLGVEVSSREDGLRKQEAENRVLILAYRDNGTTSTINFMSGTKINNATDASGDSIDYRALTTNCMDMYVTDLVDYGTTEMLGIKSINISYDASEVPRVSVEFTDVRGMSLFQPKELNYDKSFNGIRGLSKDNIAQTFFQCFFDLPLPKFTMQIKGFYGAPVTYQMACESFKTKFNSTTGDFDISTVFIGFRYSFMTDISLPVLLAAPYSDYIGEEYWKTQVNNGRFKLRGKNGESQDMPRLYDVRENFETLFNNSNDDFQVSELDDEERFHHKEMEDLALLKKNIKDWYDKFFEILQQKFGKEMSYLFKNGNEYDRIMLLTNNKDSLNGDLVNLYGQLDDDFRKKTSDLYSMIEEYNKTAESFNKIKNLVSPNLTGYKSQKIFKKVFVDVNTDTFVFDGFDPKCDLPREKTIKTLFPNGSDQNKLRKIYNDGIDEYIYAFIVEVEFAGIDNRIASLQQESNMNDDERTKREKIKRFNQSMFEKMNWYPTIENFTRIVIAHLETLMAMMNNVVTRVTNANDGVGRVVTDLGISLDQCTDINTNETADNQFVPPFPRIARLVHGDDGITNKEDAWIGEYGKPGGEIPEVDMVNGLFNAINKIHIIEGTIQEIINENSKEDADLDDLACVVKYPTTPYDFYIRKSIYGDNTDTSSNIYSFIGKVCLRMFDVLAINSFRYQFKDTWKNNAASLGKVEAMNFYELVKIKNPNILKSINVGGEFENGEMVWNVVTGKYTGLTADNCPWGTEKLLSDEEDGTVWLDRYKAKDNRWVYPAQNFNFETLEDVKNMVASDKYPNENDDVMVSDVSNPNTFLTTYIDSGENNAFFNLMIEDNRDRFYNALVAASSSSSEEAYSDICKNYINEAIKYVPEKIAAVFASPEGNTSTAFTPSSFIDKLPDEAAQSGSLKMGVYEEKYRLSNDGIGDYASCTKNEEITNCINLSEVFASKYDSETKKYKLNINESFFHEEGKPKAGLEIAKTIAPHYNAILFLMGITGINYANVANLFGDNTFVFIPKIALLQIGAALAVLVYNNKPGLGWSIEGDITKETFDKLNEIMPLPVGIENVCKTINSMSVLSKMYIIKYFVNWAKENGANIMELAERNHFHHFIDTKVTKDEKGIFKGREVVILRQDNEAVQNMTKELLSIAIIVRGNINSFVDNRKVLSKKECPLKKDDVIAYLDAFLNKLRELNNIGDENGDITQLAKSPDKTTDDMKLDVYRYLKQIYDKWFPTTDMKDWKVESFFGDPGDTSDAGHQFHFIDSYYNKINHKLLINPKRLSKKIFDSINVVDANVTMQTLLANVYVEHNCFLKCIQNFADLEKQEYMNNMFTPVPYTEMGGPKIHPDFVVVYTYEPSRNLNIDNGEFKDDSFMLNDEMETPIAIRSRSESINGQKNYYNIPAFGVSYGRQYQSYFKNVSVGMDSPIQTQQSLKAKHAILQSARNELSKTVTSQDYYDIYSNQSYKCDVEMMGCAWVQPMMYFVLLNIPMFRGSYMIMKVDHSITPGNMVTRFTGCRMANVNNRLIQDIFSDEDTNGVIGDVTTTDREKFADVDNDCPYKVYPLIENYGNFSITADELTKAKTLMGYLKAEMSELDDNKKNLIAAGIVGNMYVESTYKGVEFDYNAILKDSDGFTAGGLAMWNDRFYCLSCMVNNEYQNFGHKEYNSRLSIDRAKQVFKDKNITAQYQCKFYINSMKNNKYPDFKNIWKKLTAATTADGVAEIICDKYEKPAKAYSHKDERMGKARLYFKNRDNTEPSKEEDTTDSKVTNENIDILLFRVIQKSLASTNSSAGLEYAHTDNNKDVPTKPLTITQQDGGNNRLAKVFDIVLNTPEYYKHVQKLYWAVEKEGSCVQSENPKAVVIITALQPDIKDQYVGVATYKKGSGIVDKSETGYNFTLAKDVKPEQVVNKNLLLSLSKKFGGKLSSYYPQFKSEELFKDTTVADCDSIIGGNGGYHMPSEVSPSAKIKINNWDVEAAVTRLIQGAAEGKHGVCARYVKLAIQAGGGPLSTKISTHELGANSDYATNLRYYGILEHHGFVKITPDNLVLTPNQNNVSIQLQAGDVAIIGKNAKTQGGNYHACMWSGTQWISDFVQNNLNVYSTAYPCAIYRYCNAKGTPKA